jgi:hypothetical protein
MVKDLEFHLLKKQQASLELFHHALVIYDEYELEEMKVFISLILNYFNDINYIDFKFHFSFSCLDN